MTDSKQVDLGLGKIVTAKTSRRDLGRSLGQSASDDTMMSKPMQFFFAVSHRTPFIPNL